MNSIAKDGQVHDFTTRDELFAIARKISGTDITHIYRDGLQVFGVDTRPVMCAIGTSMEPVLFIGELQARKGIDL